MGGGGQVQKGSQPPCCCGYSQHPCLCPGLPAYSGCDCCKPRNGVGRRATPLYVAAINGQGEIVRRLLANPVPVDVDAADSDNASPLYVACREACVSAVARVHGSGTFDRGSYLYGLYTVAHHRPALGRVFV